MQKNMCEDGRIVHGGKRRWNGGKIGEGEEEGMGKRERERREQEG